LLSPSPVYVIFSNKGIVLFLRWIGLRLANKIYGF
jgi:hypothetical protein